ncbi:50S ribosomal protein L18 [archaeon]|nr:50S ribosomal protein L18 [archaeon]|tara:strand:- start:2391 stop:2978 length:588 start_codon:yes stop_codon:yes gene_type:complete
MAKGKIPVVQYRRKASGRTNYRKRLRLLMSGKDRLVVRFSGNSVTAQIVNYHQTGDKVAFGVNSAGLEKFGWKFGIKSIPASYLTGLLLAKQAKAKNYSGELILDTGFATIQKQGRMFAVLKGVMDGGLLIKHGETEILPDENTVSGKKIAEYAELLKKDANEKYKKQFSKCILNGVDPIKMPEEFVKIKQALLG